MDETGNRTSHTLKDLNGCTVVPLIITYSGDQIKYSTSISINHLAKVIV